MLDAITHPAQKGAQKRRTYAEIKARLASLLEDEDDLISMLSTVVCELHHSFEDFHWTGFYRSKGDVLLVGPYQGTHGCLRIPFSRGVCGAAATSRQTQRHDDVALAADHIACSSTTISEIVVPVIHADGRLLAVLDIDSNRRAAFDEVDEAELEELARLIASRWI